MTATPTIAAPAIPAPDYIGLRPSPVPNCAPECSTEDSWNGVTQADGDAPIPAFRRAHRPACFRPVVCCECDDHAIEGEAWCHDCFARENAKPVAGETEEQAADRHAARMAVVREGEFS